ncbi:phosphoribosylaminoimidazole-succinocarboxamide synthase [Rhodopirellula maiorica SM1]|uniref:Phosphoribosylaminoimidazole-succinocarboxamide synthase n=2 Tax=Novipirellula TaxID=2795426 RepID=M5RI65_9BACT|nr:phosphoribosylaminoimidazole-succinocarboxamide synthase [Rhodopirellula maiorica SM1]
MALGIAPAGIRPNRLVADSGSFWQSNCMSTPNESSPPDLYRFDACGALLSTHLPMPRRSGKVRDVYDLGDSLMIVSSDRISAFDYILPSGIPNKGRLLTQMSRFWFSILPVRHHLLTTEIPETLSQKFDTSPLEGRTMIVEKADVVPFECVVRGYLEGSGLLEYQATGEICGNALPQGLKQCDALPEPIFTPATKAEEGHDENVSFDRMASDIGTELAEKLRDQSLRIYRVASEHAASKGLIIADTKFEFGRVDDELVLVDEVLTPDSSRFWNAASYAPGSAQPSFDKQFVREYLSQCGWDKQSDPPPLPAEVIERTAAKYTEAFERITGETFS